MDAIDVTVPRRMGPLRRHDYFNDDVISVVDFDATDEPASRVVVFNLVVVTYVNRLSNIITGMRLSRVHYWIHFNNHMQIQHSDGPLKKSIHAYQPCKEGSPGGTSVAQFPGNDFSYFPS